MIKTGHKDWKQKQINNQTNNPPKTLHALKTDLSDEIFALV